jgi:hypothetical protein
MMGGDSVFHVEFNDVDFGAKIKRICPTHEDPWSDSYWNYPDPYDI